MTGVDPADLLLGLLWVGVIVAAVWLADRLLRDEE